jgi:ketosteroid isomerase-like protein
MPSSDTDIRQACADVASRFFRCLDRRQYDELASLFASGGTWVRQGAELRGRDAIVAALAQRPATLVTRHLLSNVWVDIESPETAHVHYDVSVYARTEAGPPRHSQILSGVDRFIRVGDAWRIDRKEAQPALVFVSA